MVGLGLQFHNAVSAVLTTSQMPFVLLFCPKAIDNICEHRRMKTVGRKRALRHFEQSSVCVFEPSVNRKTSLADRDTCQGC